MMEQCACPECGKTVERLSFSGAFRCWYCGAFLRMTHERDYYGPGECIEVATYDETEGGP